MRLHEIIILFSLLCLLVLAMYYIDVEHRKDYTKLQEHITEVRMYHDCYYFGNTYHCFGEINDKNS